MTVADPSGEDLAALYHRAIATFAEALAVTPADQLAHRQPRQYGRRKVKPVYRRDVLVDGITAAGDLLAMEHSGGDAR